MLAIGADVYPVTEHRLTIAGQREYDVLLADQGYSALWGAPCQRRRGKVKPGGVAVVLRKGFQARIISGHSPERIKLHEEGRLLHVALHLGAQVVHMFVVYGHPNAGTDREQRLKNELLLAAVLKWAAELGDVPVLICGDLNTPAEASAVLSSALSTAKLWDMGSLAAMADGLEPANTCFQNTNVHGHTTPF